MARLVSLRRPQPNRVRRRLPGLGLVGIGGDQEGVLAVVHEPVALLRDHRPEQDVPRIRDLAHSCSSLAVAGLRARLAVDLAGLAAGSSPSSAAALGLAALAGLAGVSTVTSSPPVRATNSASAAWVNTTWSLASTS